MHKRQEPHLLYDKFSTYIKIITAILQRVTFVNKILPYLDL